MPITTREIANIGSPPDDPTCPLPGILYVPDLEVFSQPLDCVVATVAGHFTEAQDLRPLDRPLRDLANQGFLCLAFWVRLLNPITGQTTTGKYAQQTDDFKIGVRYMRSDPGGFGYSVTGFVAAIGGSGSAHHALYSALDGTPGDDRADAAICMSPATDFSDRDDDVTQAFIDKVTAYADTTDLPTLLARSPIALSLDDVAPILHYNGDAEAMPLSQLTRFRDYASDIVTYSSRINTGTLGQVHSFAMWPQIKDEAIAWLFQWTGGTVTPPPPLPPPEATTSRPAREGSFRRVFNRVILKLGRDPFKNIPYELTRAVVEHINQRVSIICPIWRWPEWEVTEERAFRQVWNSDHQYYVGTDEVFYIPELKYYAAGGTSAADPPIGSLPTNTAYWTEIETVDTFIEYNQTCKRPIGMVLKVWPQNPRIPTGNTNGQIRFQPSEKGIDVFGASKTVFITYQKPVPRYTMTPIVEGYSYLKGEVRFDPESGECYQAVSDNTGRPVSDTTSWRILPMLDRWANYVVEGAFADSLSELDQGGNENVSANLALAIQANERAEKSLAVACNELLIQGQRFHHFLFPPSPPYYFKQQPWAGGEVTTLTDECEDGGVAPRVPPRTGAQIRDEYRDEIVAILTVDGVPSLEQLPTAGIYLPGSRVAIIIGDDGQTEMHFKLYDGSADPDDAGEVEPDDYDVDDNNVHWGKVS